MPVTIRRQGDKVEGDRTLPGLSGVRHFLHLVTLSPCHLVIRRRLQARGWAL